MSKSKILLGAFLCFVFTILLSQIISARILFFVALLSFFLKQGNFSAKDLLSQSWDMILFFSILLIGLLYSTDYSLGLRQIETNLSLIGIPMVIYNLSAISKERLDQVFYAFLSGILIASVICLGNALISYAENGDLQMFFFSKLTLPIDSHPTYFAYYLIFTITYGLYVLFYESFKFSTYLAVALLLFLFLMLMLTGGQTSFISMLLIFSFFMLKYLLGERSRKETIVVCLIVIMTISMFGFISILQNSEQFHSLSNQNDYWERMMLWESALKANTNPLLGVGTGDYNLVLNEYYRSHDLLKYAKDNFNSHNQFIQIYFSNGIIGLLSLIILMGRPLYLAVKSQNLLGILIFFPFIIYGVTEVFLGRYQGVVFFGLLHQVFISHYYTTNLESILKAEKF